VGASQFADQAVQQADGKVNVSGSQDQFPAGVVEYRFLLIQDGVIVTGSGTGEGGVWTGTTNPGGQKQLQEGPVLGVGLAIAVDTGNSPGFSTFSWAEQLELVNG
jgi:hypothetical protein